MLWFSIVTVEFHCYEVASPDPFVRRDMTEHLHAFAAVRPALPPKKMLFGLKNPSNARSNPNVSNILSKLWSKIPKPYRR